MTISEPRTGLHSYRIFDIAIIDVILTLIASVLLCPNNIITTFIILIILSILLHTIFGIKTKTNSFFFEKVESS